MILSHLFDEKAYYMSPCAIPRQAGCTRIAARIAYRLNLAHSLTQARQLVYRAILEIP
jgi:hypothetical protein